MHKKIKVLFLAVGPSGEGARLKLDEEVRAIGDALRRGGAPDALELVSDFATRTRDLGQALLRHGPQVLHFAGNPDAPGEICLRDERGRPAPVDRKTLEKRFEIMAGVVRVVVLNGCDPRSAVEAVGDAVDYVIAMKPPLRDPSAVRFAAGFYAALSRGHTVPNAFRLGVAVLRLDGGDEADVPVLRVRPGADPEARLVTLPPTAAHPGPPDRPGQRIRSRAADAAGQDIGTRKLDAARDLWIGEVTQGFGNHGRHMHVEPPIFSASLGVRRAGEPPEHPPKPLRPEPPRAAHARLDAPETVVTEEAFEATVGLSKTKRPGVNGPPLELPEQTVYPYVVAVQLVAEGFELADGDSWRRECTATEAEPFPSTVFRLRALPQAEPVRPRALEAIYSVGGQTIGFAVRPVAVVRTAADRPEGPLPKPPPRPGVRVPVARAAPDLTIHVLRDPDVRERLLWTTESPHAGVARRLGDARHAASDIGDRPREFARQLVQQIAQQDGRKTLELHVRGIAKRIAGKIPGPVWEAVHAAARAAGGPPSILILSEEPYVPWELAMVPEPLPVPGAPPFLGAQANVGRWILGQATPALPPPHALDVETMAVVWGDYHGSRWGRLEAAREEADALEREFGAELVDATLDPVLECLYGSPPAQALHFALHGVYNPGGSVDGLVLADGQSIHPVQVSGAYLPERPLVFLNACQVGSGQEVLGDQAGMASAFLEAHASAVVAPLWSVRDEAAKELSVAFYREAFEGEPVAAVLRRQRARFGEDDNCATCLGYQFFGHPELRLSRAALAGAGAEPFGRARAGEADDGL
jgi:CHAT domain